MFIPPAKPDARLIRRVVGLPGEEIEGFDDKLTINGRINTLSQLGFPSGSSFDHKIPKIKLGEKQFFLLGDNLRNSKDGRDWGATSFDQIVGIVTKICNK
jgi:signal peptidase I